MKAELGVNFLTGGDIAPDREDSNRMFGEIASLFEINEFSFVNLEHPLSHKGQPNKLKKSIHRGSPEMIDGIAEANIDAVVLANNHMLDFGDEALFETIDLLKARSILSTGAGENIKVASKPISVEKNGIKIGVLSYSTRIPKGYAASLQKAGINPLRLKSDYLYIDEKAGSEPQIKSWTIQKDLNRMLSDIRLLRKKCDVVIVYQHWGESMVPHVNPYQTEIGHAAIDAGADAIFGGHQHVISPIEFYNGKPIVHGTGNLLVDGTRPHFTETAFQSFLFGCKLVKGGIKDCYILPTRCGMNRSPELHPIRSKAGHEIIATLQRLSVSYGTRFKVKDDIVQVMPLSG